jgi:hypothetical protein
MRKDALTMNKLNGMKMPSTIRFRFWMIRPMVTHSPIPGPDLKIVSDGTRPTGKETELKEVDNEGYEERSMPSWKKELIQ